MLKVPSHEIRIAKTIVISLPILQCHFRPGGVAQKKPSLLELTNVKKFRKGIISSKHIKKGELLKKNNLQYARPIVDYNSNELNILIGKRAKKDIPLGNVIIKKNIK